MQFLITTLGCKVNQHESDVLAAALSARGWHPADSEDIADVCIINTCTVTQKASMQSRQLIRQLQRNHPGARIVVTGCYAQIAPEDIEAIDGVHAIVGHHHKYDLPDIIVNAMEEDPSDLIHRVAPLDAGTPFRFHQTVAAGNRTRPFLKIQDGCNSYCTYCIVPHARGRSRSMPPEHVLGHLRDLAGKGYHEVVLTGIHLGAYGLDFTPPTPMLSLLEQIDKERPLTRIRLSSIEPHELSIPIIDLVASSELFCPHFHLPLQSGDNRILQRMHRPYTRELFRQQVLAVASRLPDAAIGVDVLIGFPGEDDRAFENTLRLLEDLPIAYLHVFPYSRRPGTPAYHYPDQIPPPIVKERTARVRALGKRKKRSFHQRSLGTTTAVLVETRRDHATGLLKGMTANYLAVLLEGDDGHMNTIVPAHLEQIDATQRLRGEIIN